jgi:hypothetical protein
MRIILNCTDIMRSLIAHTSLAGGLLRWALATMIPA